MKKGKFECAQSIRIRGTFQCFRYFQYFRYVFTVHLVAHEPESCPRGQVARHLCLKRETTRPPVSWYWSTSQLILVDSGQCSKSVHIGVSCWYRPARGSQQLMILPYIIWICYLLRLRLIVKPSKRKKLKDTALYWEQPINNICNCNAMYNLFKENQMVNNNQGR